MATEKRLIEGIPVPVNTVVEWEHHRYVEPTYYGEKPRLVAFGFIRAERRQAKIMAQGGKTVCKIYEIADGVTGKPTRDQLYLVARAEVDCSKEDNYIKSIGRKRSLSKALSIYYREIRDAAARRANQSSLGVGQYKVPIDSTGQLGDAFTEPGRMG